MNSHHQDSKVKIKVNLTLLLLKLISSFPLIWQEHLGKFIGRKIFPMLKDRRSIIKKNCDLCFPEWSEVEREILVNKNIDNTGIAILETMRAWSWNDKQISKNVTIEGLEKLIELQKEQRGIILLGVHTVHMEMAIRALSIQADISGVYRANKKAFVEHLQVKGRTKSNLKLINRKDVRTMIKTLKGGQTLWFAADQDYGNKKGSAFAPFYNVEACTITTIRDLQRISNSLVVSVSFIRKSDGHYKMEISDPLTDIICNSAEEHAVAINKLNESLINLAPEQYMWIHRRFKNRPLGECSVY
ncbi:LpxL/LpxP family Kdo(2)-lipid IV(A) lauroyl/palmitoleoyl acyltransferase [Vibrio sp. SS-MA-C1-2]|uniref:LpxL/LpxP family Kdo(2)-lipid IV(A) lauroyl/palmitoleoyl acyltransferase n=1 Tax=Vibrio sp. SS-MA-C1-2 TaxID=2908646 RepID=UPI001F3EC8E9|nr:LpxL/LpxP family Kdo(2)-lipid IV(A) lauroyl/palmitoleoyl acyltransferase [Vibrio sp. SS-MA-C1-2]UJF18751.1 LpxL/LpxP family Kdo(2)-lipid IV(A) lauroyl/palmitoleoyl acyltransferase [Vibrio sp. SS-MA-C1-2]